jgi:hypothetical protein
MTSTSNPTTEQIMRTLALARSKGVTIRNLAKLIGVSKSTMGRWMPVIDILASQMGQGAVEKADTTSIPADVCPKWDREETHA